MMSKSRRSSTQSCSQRSGQQTGISAELPGPGTTLFPDTSADAAAVLLGLLREAPPWRKLQMVGELNETVRVFALAGLRRRHPGLSEAHLRRRLADLLLGPELARRAYGPLQEGD